MSNKRRRSEPFDDDLQNDSVESNAEEGFQYPVENDVYAEAVENLGATEKPEAAQKWNDVAIKLVNLDTVDGRVLVYLAGMPAKVYWVSVEQVRLTTREQVVSSKILDGADKPYNWDIELDEIAVDINTLRLGLYYLGYHSQQEINIREVMQKLLSRGFLPVKKG